MFKQEQDKWSTGVTFKPHPAVRLKGLHSQEDLWAAASFTPAKLFQSTQTHTQTQTQTQTSLPCIFIACRTILFIILISLGKHFQLCPGKFDIRSRLSLPSTQVGVFLFTGECRCCIKCGCWQWESPSPSSPPSPPHMPEGNQIMWDRGSV